MACDHAIMCMHADLLKKQCAYSLQMRKDIAYFCNQCITKIVNWCLMSQLQSAWWTGSSLLLRCSCMITGVLSNLYCHYFSSVKLPKFSVTKMLWLSSVINRYYTCESRYGIWQQSTCETRYGIWQQSTCETRYGTGWMLGFVIPFFIMWTLFQLESTS
jgi:hypothetical protein